MQRGILPGWSRPGHEIEETVSSNVYPDNEDPNNVYRGGVTLLACTLRLRIPAVLAVALVHLGCGDNVSIYQSCESSSCHGPSGRPNGIELAHPAQPLSCTDCHGGDGDAEDKDGAHVAPAPQWVADRRGYLRNLSTNELDQVDPDYLRFVNPGDYRVAGQSCGSASPAGGSGCHQSIVDSAPRSTMATFVGHFNVPRFQAGLQDRPGLYGSQSISDAAFPEPAPQGAVTDLVQAVIPPEDAPRDTVATAMDHYLPKNCTHCHQGNFGRNEARGNFRSSGCTACHMLYNDDGISLSSDPSAIREQPPHPEKHQLTVAIPENQCEHCHYQGARIGLLYRGVIEYGFTQKPPLPNIGEMLHNHPPEFYLDAASDPRYPPDVHYTAGMACADCHVGRDVHGDGRLYSTAKFQVSIRCENCHGNIDSAIREGMATPPLIRGGTSPYCQPKTGRPDQFWNCNGDPLKNLYRKSDGTIWLKPVKGGADLPVAQVSQLIASGNRPRMAEIMGRDAESGLSHTEVIECDGCHTAYRQYCFGCHVTMDYSQKKSDLLTGVATFGAEITGRQDYSLDLYFLGQNHRGKIGSFCPSMQVFLTAIDKDPDGEYFTYFADRVRTTASGKVGFNWAVDAPHVVSTKPQPCSLCHADQSQSCSTDKARQTYGFGTGRYTFTDESGTTHDLTQLLDSSGDPLVDFSHEGQGPVPREVRDRAMAICVED